MISFVLAEEYDIDRFFRSVRLIALAESLGGVESLISNPATMTHASIPYDIRQKTGIVDHLVRISVGIEDKRDIVADLAHAFNLAKK
jgi:cystathionine beta-lyase